MNHRGWVLVLLAAGCASEMSSANRLDEALRAFHHHLKGRDLERASSYVTREAMEDFLALHGERRNGLEMEEFQVETVRFLRGAESSTPLQALVLVTLQARQANSLVVRPIRVVQTWEQRGSRWVLTHTAIAPDRREGADTPGANRP